MDADSKSSTDQYFSLNGFLVFLIDGALKVNVINVRVQSRK